MYPEWVKGSRRSGELIEWVYKKIDRCVNLEWVAVSRLTGESLYGQLTIDSRARPGKFHEELLILAFILNSEPNFSRAAFKYMEAIACNDFRLRNSRSMIRAYFFDA